MNKSCIIMDPIQSSSPDRGLNLSSTMEVPADIFDGNEVPNPRFDHSVDDESSIEYESPQIDKWKIFLESLHAKLSQYEIQKDRRNYNVADLDDWAKPGKRQGIVISLDSFGIFMNKLSDYGLAEYKDIKNIIPTEMQLEELNSVLNFTLKYRINIWCKEDNIYVKGNYISLLDVLNYETDKSDIENTCKNYLDLLQSGKLKGLTLFALRSVFIDKDVSYPLNLISPKWEVIGNRKLDMKGSQGPPHSKPVAPDGKPEGKDGEHGKPGLPGKPGGSFFGIGSTFVNGANLTISVNGGTGGSGQSGGNGGIGATGHSGSPPQQSGNLNEVLGYGVTMDGFKWEKSSYDKYDKNDHPHILREWRKVDLHYYDFFHESYKFFGKPGGKGGDGGNGGKGGKGGKPGSIVLVEFGSSSEIKEQRDYGEEGAVGKGGSGGRGGETGDDLIARVYVQRPISYMPQVRGQKDQLWWLPKETIPNHSVTGPPGKNGVDGVNEAKMQEPESGVAAQEMDSILNEYKLFIMENLSDNLKKSELLQFLQQINSNKNTTNVYQTLGLVNEMIGLEEQFPKLHNEVDFTPLYQSVLNRTSEYAENSKEEEKSPEYRKVQSYLYTATLGRLSNLREGAESDLVINISRYLDMVKKDIEALKELQDQRNKADIINRYKENYKSGVDQKIDEAKTFIQKKITPEISNVENEIEKKIDLLIKETIKLQDKAEDEKEALIRKKKELESTLAVRGIFSGFKIFGQVVSFLGPIGAAIGSVIETTTSVTESLVLNRDHSNVKFGPSIMSNIKSLADQVKIVKNKKTGYLNSLIEDISQKIKSNPEKLGDITITIRNIKTKLIHISDKKLNVKELSTIENELKEILKKKEDGLESEKDDPDKKNSKALSTIKKFSQIVKLGPHIFDIYNKYKDDQDKIDTLNNAITQSENKLQKLKEYEENIYSSLIPMLQSLETDLSDIAEKLSTKSLVSLDVTKWQVQSTLKDIKLQITQATDGFEVKEDLARCIEKLEEAMTTLINIYDRIQNYQEQQNLANYIADISSAAANSIHIKDPQLLNATNRLEESIRSNLVLKEYKTAFDAFKQWVFPFAEYYLGKSVLPSHLKLDKNIEDLVSSAASRVENMKQKVELYKTSVKSTDKYIQKGEFSSRWKSTDPFFIWKNENYRDEISQLLSGKEVVLKSDIRRSATDKDAIKFSVIDLVFKSRNETLQPKLTETLKDFDIRATHLGNSYYRYADEICLITSNSQTILYSYEKNSAGEPVRRNNVFDKIKSGDLMLSPYTLWEFKLRNSTSRSSFKELQIFEDEIDLELSGHGSYVLRDVDLYSVTGKPARKTKRNIEYEKDRRKMERRHVDSFETDQRFGSYMTNGASPGLSSPINYIPKLFKTGLVSSVVISLHRMFFKNIFVESDSNEIGTVKGSTNDPVKIVDVAAESKIQETEQSIRSRETEKHIVGLLSKYRATDKAVLYADDSVDICIDSRDYGNYRNLRLFGGNQGLQDNQTIHIPDINCSLLLADLISRFMTKNKYKISVDESLLSPQQKIQRKLSHQIMNSEKDIKQHLYLLSSEVDDRGATSLWFNKAKSYFRSAFQFFGLVEVGSSEDYLEDIRNLFISANSN